MAPVIRKTLPGAAYHSDETWALDAERVFYRNWIYVGRAERVAKPGAWMRVEIADESVLVVHGKDGRLRAFYNVCRHRGSRICDDESGFTRSHLRCPYHAWGYALDGTLVTSAASFGRVVTDLRLALDKTTKDVLVAQADNVIVTRNAVDPRVQRLVDRYRALAAPLADREVGRITGDVTRSRSTVGCSPVSRSSFADPSMVWTTSSVDRSRGRPRWTPASIIASTTKNRYAGPVPEIAVTASW